MDWLLVAATEGEIRPFLNRLEAVCRKQEAVCCRDQGLPAGVSVRSFYWGDQRGDVLITGVGLPFTALRLGAFFSGRRALGQAPYALVVHAGIAGSFDRRYSLGTVVEVVADGFADLGAEQADGRFADLFELGLLGADKGLFGEEGYLYNTRPVFASQLPQLRGISVNRVHGYQPSINALLERYERFPPQIESMEGAAFFLSCLTFEQPFTALRAVSNFVEPRDKEAWDIPLAVERLGDFLCSALLPERRD